MNAGQPASPSSPTARRGAPGGGGGGDNAEFPMHVFVVGLMQPTTKLAFEQWVREGDNETKELLQRISRTREELVSALTRSTPEAALRSLDAYIPCELGLMEGLGQAAAATGNPVARNIRVCWTSSVSVNFLKNPMVFNSMSSELFFSYMTAAFLHRAAAAQRFGTIFASQEAFDEGSKEVARSLCMAAGIFEFIRDTQCLQFKNVKYYFPPFCVQFEGELTVATRHGRLDPPVAEITEHFQTLFINLCLAEAQQIAVQKAMAKGTSDSLLSKLILDISQKYNNASFALKAITGVEFVESFRLYLTLNNLLFSGLTYKHLARDAHANGEYGRAVAYMQKAVGEVPEKPKGRFTDAAFQSFVNVYGAERDELVKLAKAYASDNDAIYYDRVPPES
ncbi:uncharacterized protein ACA1_253960, partial [Acanthamoeba castellanii str. Neff]